MVCKYRNRIPHIQKKEGEKQVSLLSPQMLEYPNNTQKEGGNLVCIPKDCIFIPEISPYSCLLYTSDAADE